MEKLMEGGSDAAPFRLRYYPAPAWARMAISAPGLSGVGARAPSGDKLRAGGDGPG